VAEIFQIKYMLTTRQKMFIARMLNRCIRPLRRITGQGMQTRCARKGIEWDLDLDEGVDLCIYLQGAYEPRALRAYSAMIQPGDIVFDIGANIGAHTLHFSRLVGPVGKVYAFEPTDYAFSKLRANLALNPELAMRVNPQQRFLVADHTELLPPTVFSRWPVANEHQNLDFDHLGKLETLAGATAITADEFCEAMDLQHVDFVKIDVDGHELPVLQGFRRSLERFKPRILIEIAPFIYKNSDPQEFDRLVHLLAGLGYIFTDSGNGRQVSCDPVVLRRKITPGGAINCILLPSSKT
jgi:FkbM family methyltransferase